MNNVGIGLITCNRESFFQKAYESIKDYLQNIVIVNDGNKLSDNIDIKSSHHLIQHDTNKGVGISKNDCIRYLMNNKKIEYIILMEDDIIVKDINVIDLYINLYKLTNIHHFNYGYHGPANRNMINYNPSARLVINLGDKMRMALNKNCVGAFSFYTRECLEKCGLLDERYVNAFEHCCHTLTIAENNMHPPFWWFPDLHESWKYIEEQQSSFELSAIRNRPDWKKNCVDAAAIFLEKHGHYPTKVPDTSESKVIQLITSMIKGK